RTAGQRRLVDARGRCAARGARPGRHRPRADGGLARALLLELPADLMRKGETEMARFSKAVRGRFALRTPPRFAAARIAIARVACAALFSCLALAAPVQAERIKELASIQGVRANQLIGYGLVVGLDGSGDQTTQAPFTVQSLQSML